MSAGGAASRPHGSRDAFLGPPACRQPGDAPRDPARPRRAARDLPERRDEPIVQRLADFVFFGNRRGDWRKTLLQLMAHCGNLSSRGDNFVLRNGWRTKLGLIMPAFEPETAEAMGRAFEMATASLVANDPTLREAIALKIVAAAQATPGADPVMLCRAALDGAPKSLVADCCVTARRGSQRAGFAACR